ncbi:MAG: hypothetical protein ACR2O5_05540 [Thiogranum sp.]
MKILKVNAVGSATLVAAVVLLMDVALADPQDDLNRLQSVGKLVETSSAALKVDGSGNRQAMAQHEKARDLFGKAKKAAAAGNQVEADDLLKQATQTMYEAVRMVGTDQSLVDKDNSDFDARLESVHALTEAYDRIRKEKGLGSPESSELYPIVQSKLEQARGLKGQGKVKEARQILDEAYVAAKVAIEHLRGGDTLVRSLTFASSEEEYQYEVDRNDTHRMLVSVLLKEKVSGSSGVEGMVEKFMDKAADLRQQAEKQASKGDFEAAIQTLEQSTKEIVRAIRGAGIYIPG